MSKKEQEIFSVLQELIIDILPVSKEEIHLEAHFIHDLQAESLDIVDLMMGIEERYNITIKDEHAERILTVQNAVDYILEYVD